MKRNLDKMVAIPSLIVDCSMTLVIAAKNKESIVVGVDSLWAKRGKLRTGAQKLYVPRDDCAILVAGESFSVEAVDSCLKSFADPIEYKQLTRITDIADELSRWCNSFLSLKQYKDFVLLVAGYDGSTPKIFRLHTKIDSFKAKEIQESYAADGRRSFAEERLKNLGINNATVDSIGENIYSIISDASSKFPTLVGGEIIVRQIKPLFA